MSLRTILASCCAAALLLGSTAAAQKATNPGKGPTNPGTGGGYTGPGDTVPTPGSGGGGGPTPDRPPPPSTPPPPVPESPYAGGANPLAPRETPPGLEGVPGSPTSAPPPVTPTSPPRTDTLNTWQMWWHYNRWAHLEVEGSLATETDSGGFFLGQGEKTQPGTLLRATKIQVRDVVQPALANALARGGQVDFEIFTSHALAKIRGVPAREGRPDFEHVIRPMLRSGNQALAEKSVLALGIRGDDRYLPWLTAILADSAEGRELVGRSLVPDRLRAFAAYGLGLLGERTSDSSVLIGIFGALMEALPVEREEVQAACLMALGLTPMPTGDTFIEGGAIFGGKTRVDQVLAILNFFEDSSQSFVVRSQAPNALARLVAGAPESVRGRVAYALLVASSPLSDELREVQNAAVIGLGQIGRSGAEPLDQEIRGQLERIAYRSNADRSTRYLAMIALAETAVRRGHGEEPFAGLEPARRVFLRNLSRSRGETLAWTALALGVLEEDARSRGDVAAPESGRALRYLMEKSQSAEVGGALAIALGLMRDQEAVDLLRTRMLETGDTYMRAYCALALGMIGAPQCIGPVRDVLAAGTEQPPLVENAAISLALLGDQDTGKQLAAILARSSNPQVQASIASAMGWIKDPRPLSDLCKMLNDTRRNDIARAWTAVAIGRICDADRWPWVGRLSAGVMYDVALPTLLEPTFETGLLDLP